VSVSIGGIEIGQGINTKRAQVGAKEVSIPHADLITVVFANSFVAPNGDSTGGSWASDNCAIAASVAARQLLARIEAAAGDEPDWKSKVRAAHAVGVDLVSRHASNAPEDGFPSYDIHGAAIVEVNAWP